MKASLNWWVHDLDPFLIRFPKGFWIEGIRWYGVAYLLGFLCAAGLLSLYYKKNRSPLNSDKQTLLMTSLIVGVLVGGRLGYMLFYNFSGLVKNPLSLFYIWEGGMASHGGFIGVTIAILWVARKLQLSPLKVSDIVVTLAPSGILFGRLANFINGYIWGTKTDVAWAIIFPKSATWVNMPLEMIAPRHPISIYAALLEGLVLLIWTQWRFWKKPALPIGVVTGEFLAGYAILRIFNEFFREPDAGLILGMNRGQFYSIFILIAGIGIMIYARKRAASSV